MTPTDPTSEPQSAQKHQYLEPPQGGDALAKKWQKRIASAKKHWEKFHKRVKHNRELVAGFNWKDDPTNESFYKHRANLIHGTITAILPAIYARNPEIAVAALHEGRDLKALCKTIEKVTNKHLTDGKLKKRAKAAVRAALTCSFGAVKVMYQRDMQTDPIIQGRIQDTQDQIARIEALLLQLSDDQARSEQELLLEELKLTMAQLQEQVEVVAGQGMVVDRVLTDHLLLDPSLAEFDDYPDSDWMIQLIPMKKSTAEGQFKYKLDKATAYKEDSKGDSRGSGKVFSGPDQAGDDDCQILICEIWDKQSGNVLTTAEGLDFWLREPYVPPKLGERWYPFFLLPFQLVDGQVIGPSLVDLTEKLQSEHNEVRDKEKAHRDLIKPGYYASAEVSEKTIKNVKDSVLGEITILDAGGQPLNSVIQPKNFPAMDPKAYDTSPIRYDWEQVSGMQDAARSTVVQAKTATEASIQQQALSGRVSEFRDQVEDFLQDIAQYAAQILLLELSPAQVEAIMGPNKTGPIPGTMDPMTGQPMVGVVEKIYDWPQLSREQVYGMVQMTIRAGSTGEPDKLQTQQVWVQLMPMIQPLIMQIMQMRAGGNAAEPLVALLKETVLRFDEKIDVEAFLPPVAQPAPMLPPMGGMPGAAPALPAPHPQGPPGAQPPLPPVGGPPQLHAVHP